MDFSKTVLLLALTVLLVVNDSTQFLVANCVWDEALAGVANGRGFVLSDGDACALFCGAKPNGGGGGVAPASSDAPQGAASPSNAALCDRCCKSSQPPSKPGELLVSILHTLIKAFGPSKESPGQTLSTDTIPQGKPVGEDLAPPNKPPPAETPSRPTSTADSGPVFGTDDDSSVTVNFDEPKSRPAEFVDNFNNRDFQPQSQSRSRAGRLESDPRRSGGRPTNRDRAYPEPEARIFEITGGNDGSGPEFNQGFDRAAGRGPGWPNLDPNFPLKSGTIR